MKFHQVVLRLTALFAAPALSETFKEALEKIPDASAFTHEVLKEPIYRSMLEDPFGNPNLTVSTVFAASNKAIEEYLEARGQTSKHESPWAVLNTGYHSVVGNFTLAGLATSPLVHQSKSKNPSTGKLDALVTRPSTEGDGDGSGSKGPDQPALRPRVYGPSNNSHHDAKVTLYGGLGASSRIVTGDYRFDWGVIHLIDTVLNPPQSCSSTLRRLEYKNFQAALNKTGLGAAIDVQGITLLAYTDEVFTQKADASAATLRQHIVKDLIGYTPVLRTYKDVKTLANNTLAVTYRDGKYFVNESPIIKSDIICNNGVMHTLGKLLVPVAPVTYVPGAAPAAMPINRMAAVAAAVISAACFFLL